MINRIKYNVMNDSELTFLKNEIERLLIERGVHLDHDEMLKGLAACGCIVDMEKEMLNSQKN